jgi:hypothetical protein
VVPKYYLHGWRTHTVSIFSYSTLTCYKWGIQEIFIAVISLQVGCKFMKHPTCKRLHLWWSWGVLFLISCSPLTACTLQTKMTIPSCSKIWTEVPFVGCENIRDNLSNHIALDLKNQTIRVSHPLEVGSAICKLLLTSTCPHHSPSLQNESSSTHDCSRNTVWRLLGTWLKKTNRPTHA